MCIRDRVTGLMKKGAKLFGDDLIIIGNGRVLGYPQDFSVYPYHVSLLGLEAVSYTHLDVYKRQVGERCDIQLWQVKSPIEKRK